MVRSETPDDMVTALVNAVQKEMATDAAKQFLKNTGAEPFPLGPVAMRNYQLEELARNRRVAEGAGIKAE